MLSLRLPLNLVKQYGPHLVCKFYLVESKFFVQIASKLACMVNMDEYTASQLYAKQSSFKAEETIKQSQSMANIFATKKNAAFSDSNSEESPSDDNPETIRVFTKNPKLTLEFIKSCLLGTAKTSITKCLRLFNENFPHHDRYCVSIYWQHEFKYELYMLLANVADQCQLGYMALQYIMEALEELSTNEQENERNEFNEATVESFKFSAKTTTAQTISDNKQSSYSKRGLFEVYNLMSKSHLNSRLWLSARKLFVEYMSHQLSDLGKAKGVDTNILRDFADFKYYCDKGLEEALLFQDHESRAFFEYHLSTIDLTQSNNLEKCLSQLDASLANLHQSLQLSVDSQQLFVKASLLYLDVDYSIAMLKEMPQTTLPLIEDTIGKLINLQTYIFEKLKETEGEVLEFYIDRNQAYHDFISSNIRNISNPLLYYLVHIKLRLGSCLLIKAALQSSLSDSTEIWQDALKVFYAAAELNRVISERSVNLEIEIKYKYARCLRELFSKNLINIKPVIDTYLETLELCFGSHHDLTIIKNCLLEMAVTFIQLGNGIKMRTSNDADVSPAKGREKSSSVTSKAVEAALICLGLAIRTSQAVREKMLLPGHQSIKQMESVQAPKSPVFVANDLLAYFVLAERKRVFRDEIEEEVLTLAPEFEAKPGYQNYDEKVDKLKEESDRSITWTHLLNYQTKLQRLNSMKNLNQLSSGKNRYKFSEFFTLAFTPVFCNQSQNSARLYELHRFLRDNFGIYKSECIAAYPPAEYLRLCCKKACPQMLAFREVKFFLDGMRTYEQNRGTVEIKSKEEPVANAPTEDKTSEFLDEQQVSDLLQSSSILKNWSYMELWPLNFESDAKSKVTQENFNYLVTVNWHKDILELRSSTPNTKDNASNELITVIVGVRDSSDAGNHKLRVKLLLAEKLYIVQSQLSPLSAIADTALNAKEEGKSDMRNEFINSLIASLKLIGELFNKPIKEPTKEDTFPYFNLKPANVIALKRMFDPMFGGQSDDQSLMKFLLAFFD